MNTDMIPTGNDSATLTMSSREIAELCEKEHRNVLRDIRGMLDTLEIDALTFERVYHDNKGEARKEYLLPKDLTLTLVAGYNIALRYKIVKRLEELEAAIAAPAPVTKIDDIKRARETRLQFNGFVKLAKMMGLSGNQMILSANTATKRTTGFDMVGALGITHMEAPKQEALLTPSDIAKRLEMRSARAVNLLLTEQGLQESYRDAKGNLAYEPTDEGKAAGAIMQDTGKQHGNGTPIRQLKWSSGVLATLRDAMDSEAA